MLQPYSLINSQGKPHLGRFSKPVNEINVKDVDYRTPLNNKAGKWKKHFHFKQFQYFGGMADNLIFGCALADTAYLGAIFVYVYRISDQKMLTWQFKRPFAFGLSLTKRPDNGVSVFKSGRKHIHMRYLLNSQNERRKILEIDFGDELQLNAEMLEQSDYQAMALCTPCSINGWVYAQKTAAIPVKGQLKCALGEYDLEASHTYGHHDFSAGYMRRETFWNWACFSGTASSGRSKKNTQAIGLNVSWGVNETGYSENCFWVNNVIHTLPQAQFKFERDDEYSTWRVSTENQQVDLRFIPEGMHKEGINAGFLATHFKQIFGRFNGHLITQDGKRFEIENLYGFVEDHYSKW